jgi:hypothetical protein
MPAGGGRSGRTVVLWALLTAGCSSCSSSSARPPTDAAPEMGAVDRFVMLEGGPSACGCSIDAQGTLDLSWACYCDQSFAACAAPLSAGTDCATHVRQDYPACGLTVIVATTGAGVEVPSVYDATGTLVGRLAHSDLSGYLCPSDATMISATERAGQFPASTCAAVTCADPCYSGSFPCPALDAGTTDAGRRGPHDAALDVARD